MLYNDEWAPRKLSHEEAREEQRRHWLAMTPVERLVAATEMTRSMLTLRGIDIDDRDTDFTPYRVRRSRR